MINLLDVSPRKVINKVRKVLFGYREPIAAPGNVVSLLGELEYKRIAALGVQTAGDTKVCGQTVHFTDSVALFGMLDEIYVKGNYKFNTDNRSPVIVDCGANIGLGVLYLKSMFPDAVIHAFEPDGAVYELLQRNIEENNLKNVHTYNAAVWVEDCELSFESDGSWGGHIQENSSGDVKVKAVDLNKYLNGPIELLKIDIEGAETDVLLHAKDRIIDNVNRVFFEWHSICNEPQRLGELLSTFGQKGFRYHIKEAATRMTPFSYIPAGRMDSQLDVFMWK